MAKFEYRQNENGTIAIYGDVGPNNRVDFLGWFDPTMGVLTKSTVRCGRCRNILGSTDAAVKAAEMLLEHSPNGLCEFSPAGLIGRDDALMEKLAKLISKHAHAYHEVTDIRKTERGYQFDVRVLVNELRGKGLVPSGHVARVNVDLLVYEEPADG